MKTKHVKLQPTGRLLLSQAIFLKMNSNVRFLFDVQMVVKEAKIWPQGNPLGMKSFT